jgi:hypothetical protein
MSKKYREIREDPNAIANLPQEVIQYTVGEEIRDLPYEYDDSMSGIDSQARENHDQIVKSMRG